jgi:hypothetical protein
MIRVTFAIAAVFVGACAPQRAVFVEGSPPEGGRIEDGRGERDADAEDAPGADASAVDSTEDAPTASSIPSDVPAGWVRFDGYDPSCEFYVPPTPDLLPNPLAWESCPLGTGANPRDLPWRSLACRHMVIDGGTAKNPMQYGNYEFGAVATVSGRVRQIV